MMLLKRFPITIRTRFEELGYKKVAFREENLCVHDVQRSNVSIPSNEMPQILFDPIIANPPPKHNRSRPT